MKHRAGELSFTCAGADLDPAGRILGCPRRAGSMMTARAQHVSGSWARDLG
jgi:hypothetical protein